MDASLYDGVSLDALWWGELPPLALSLPCDDWFEFSVAAASRLD
ncbi:hypothetical protein [Burkholderia lata]|nr:hypothetical protein [Burkholderia lata]